MLFHSYIFLFIFLPFSFLIYIYLNQQELFKTGKSFLVLSSLFFYSWWNIYYLPIILSSIIINFLIGKALLKKNTIFKNIFSRKAIFILGILFNLSLLGYFKYTDFLISNYNWVFHTDIPLLHIALPLAISFFTFQQIAYLVDSYKFKTKEYKFLNYALFVTFFPQLIAGPIVSHRELIPQFTDPNNLSFNYSNISKGLFIFSIGLFKKVVIADTFAIWVTSGFDTDEILNLLEAWVTSLSFTFQLYFDFSGYADMAIGLALLFNIKLPINFNSPYKSTSLIEAWKRWHITLSQFVHMYIFKPILKQFKPHSFSKAMIAIFISMLIIGLWHGASWMFLFFGAIHGTGIVINHIWKKKLNIKLHTYIGWFITFNIINISMIFFRARTWDDAIRILSSMFSLDHIVLPQNLLGYLSFLQDYGVSFGGALRHIHGDISTILWLLFGFFLILCFKNSNELLESFQPNYKSTLYSGVLFSYSVLSLNKFHEFIYFNF